MALKVDKPMEVELSISEVMGGLSLQLASPVVEILQRTSVNVFRTPSKITIASTLTAQPDMSFALKGPTVRADVPN